MGFGVGIEVGNKVGNEVDFVNVGAVLAEFR
jgi:hypothetical protein